MAASPIHVLRGILRQIKSAPKQSLPSSILKDSQLKASALKQSDANKSSHYANPIQEKVMALYRSSMVVPSAQAESLRKMAHDFHVLKRDLRERGKLHELDGGAEVKLSPKEHTRRAAARAGLLPPELPSLDT
mmetsp:Transcript_23604/g.27849  ORF Transcript_23604/g.27849 Transcript_23604/m.27849 type:complete len:133 (-) Transcript_23604:361-759(-)|eukprot:CAMPEP_0198265218 /NCGR_PEP_ID=MMETSP1447-20131203/21066_1 /TAXON_ID=420782 /ORGANISM="Chaetoceros dichaeta, Strain CCMP1751" /LENGTH=132 /DNA_ID=CAMNT_0043954577 /DNA_START=29 /DNA_END=427 /DNA_ORIENTATION=-